MAPGQHPRFDEIKQALQNLSGSGKRFSAVCYRCTEPQFIQQIVSGLGAQLHGGRWNPIGSFPTVYLCQTVEAALKEYLARSRRMKFPDFRSLPMVAAGVKVRVANLLDLTTPGASVIVKPFLEAERIHWRTIQNRREAASQAIGRAVKQLGYSGLVVASQVSAETANIVVFPQNLSRREVLTALNTKRMP